MRIEEIEKLADQYSECDTSDTLAAYNDAIHLARALLAILPVVKAAEAWRSDETINNVWTLREELDAMNQVLK